MIGSIYSEQRCPECHGKFRDTGKDCSCPAHPHQKATRFKVVFKGASKRFRSYDAALQYLSHVRFQTREGSYDPRDWQRGKPLSISKLSGQWLEKKAPSISRKQLHDYTRWMGLFEQFIGPDTNVKLVGYVEVEDFLESLQVGDKSRANIKSCLSAFFKWAKKRKYIDAVPELPEITWDREERETTSKERQAIIVEEVYRLTRFNPRIGLAVCMLATYPKIRPGELIQVQEQDILLDQGELRINRPKGRKGDRPPKWVSLIPETVEEIRSLPRGMPTLPFFRQPNGEAFSKDYLYRWWNRAVKSLKKQGRLPEDFRVSLYPGTKHTSLREGIGSPEEKKHAAGLSSIKSFERYFRQKDSRDRELYRDMLPRRTT